MSIMYLQNAYIYISLNNILFLNYKHNTIYKCIVVQDLTVSRSLYLSHFLIYMSVGSLVKLGNTSGLLQS